MRYVQRLLLVACIAVVPAACGESLDAGGSAGGGGGSGSITVGSANFPENALLAEIYAAALRGKDVEVETRLNVGSREALFPALEKGQVDVVPEYTGALLTYVKKGRPEARDTDGQIRELKSSLPSNLTLLAPSAAQDQETVTCRKEVAEEHDLRSLEDLAPVSGELVMGGPPELPQREGFGLKGLKSVYGIEFKRFRPLDVSGPLTISALKAGKVDCANVFSTQSAIATNGFVSLEDPKQLIESESVTPLIAKDAATPEVTEALDAVSAKLTTENLKDMVKRVEVDKEDAAAVAQEFVSEEGVE